jgi:hypothetical protein
VLRRARESAHFSDAEPLSSHFASRRWSLLSQNQTSIHCLGPEGRHRRLSVCSLPVPKQSEGSLGSFISVAQSVSGGTWQSARCVILVLFLSLAWFSGRVASAIFCRHEIPLSSIHGEKICDHLARYRKRRSIGVPFLFFSFIEQREIVILSGRQLRSLDQHKLDILVALFGNRCANRLLG